jgi:hypothetical protein
MENMNRRDFFKQLAAAGTIVAAELWIPGAKLISIPSGKIFTNHAFSIDARGNITVNSLAAQNKVTVLELHRWLQDLSDSVMCMGDDSLDITSRSPSSRVTDNSVLLNDGYYVENPEYLTGGSLQQKDELWCGIQSIGQIEDTTVALINGVPAVRPGHVNQCVRAEEGDEIMVSTRTYGQTYSEFTLTPMQGTNYAALVESRDLYWADPYNDPTYELYKNMEPYPYAQSNTTKAQRLAWKDKA